MFLDPSAELTLSQSQGSISGRTRFQTILPIRTESSEIRVSFAPLRFVCYLLLLFFLAFIFRFNLILLLSFRVCIEDFCASPYLFSLKKLKQRNLVICWRFSLLGWRQVTEYEFCCDSNREA